jgi:hypothetical protein
VLGRWFSPDIPFSSTNKTEYNWNIVEIAVKYHKPKPKPKPYKRQELLTFREYMSSSTTRYVGEVRIGHRF